MPRGTDARGDVDDAGGGRQLVHHQALIVDGHADHPRAEGAEQARYRRVARVLNRDAVARLKQDPGHEIDAVLGSAGNHHRVFGRRDRSQPGHPACDGPPQFALAGRVAVHPGLDGDRGGDPAAPRHGREQRWVRQTRPQVETPVARARAEYTDKPANLRPGRRALAWSPPRAAPRTRRPPRCHRLPVPRVALGDQAAVRGGHRVPGHAGLPG